MGWHRTIRFFSWLGEWRLLYLAALYVLLGFTLILYVDASERTIRLVGLALQIIGIGTVIWGISTTRKQFGHPPILSLLTSWLRRCPLIRRPAYLQPDGISVSASLVGVRLTTVFTPNPNAPLEERLKHIEQGLETLQKRIDSAESQIDNASSIANDKVLVETRAREAADNEIMSTLEASSTGGVSISAIGALWLFVGVILSTASQELAAWLA
jgi:hypothetical protein